MKIDLHAHTTNHLMRGLHSASASIATLEALAEKHGVMTIVLLATYFPLKGTGVHSCELLKRLEGHPLFLAFGSLDVMNSLESGVAELEELARGKRIFGVKLYPGYQGFSPDDPRLEGVYRLAERHRLPVMLHGGELHHCCSAERRRVGPLPCGLDHCRLDDYLDLAHPRYVEQPALAHPKVKFVVSHLANPHFTELRGVMNRCPNVFTDLSGQFISGDSADDTATYRATVAAEIGEFLKLPDGANRVAFGTDFPIQSYPDSIELVERATDDPQTKENIFWRTGQKIIDKDFLP